MIGLIIMILLSALIAGSIEVAFENSPMEVELKLLNNVQGK